VAAGPLDEEARVREVELWRTSEGKPALKWLLSRGLTSSTIRRAKLGFDRDHLAINIPYINPDGSIRMNRLRMLNHGYMKYWTPAGQGTHLYQVVNSRLPQVWITEGEFDALILEQIGFPAVGYAGTQAFKPEWKYLFSYTKKITVVADGDEQGLNSARRVASVLGPLVDAIRVVDMPQGLDVTDLNLRSTSELRALVG
jgi:DNA primase